MSGLWRSFLGLTVGLSGFVISMTSVLPHALEWLAILLGVSSIVRGVEVAQTGFAAHGAIPFVGQLTGPGFLLWLLVGALHAWMRVGESKKSADS